MAQGVSSLSKRKKKRRLLPLILMTGGGLLLMLALVILLTSGNANAATGPTIPLLDGDTVSLSDYEGQTVLINFWASWCPPCRAEMPTLEAYYQSHRDEGFVLIAINSGESEATARSFISQSGFTFPVGLDPNQKLSQQYGANGLPLSVVIGPDGEIVYRHSGMISPAALEANVTPLLAGQ